ncbi:MAG: TolC family protein [Moraxellaceae bacterium]|nr:TolC family protein [Moraxellaceae bacterium]MDZ4385735.1 TolC family protein [Moraxellaceae bacterium]
MIQKIFLTILVVFIPATLSAQTLSFYEAQQLALANSRQLDAQTAAVVAAQELAVSAGERPDPMLKIGIESLPINGADSFSTTRDFMTMRTIGLSQEFTRGEKLKLRRERMAREAALLSANKGLLESEVLRGASKAWLMKYYLEKQLLLLETYLIETKQQLSATTASYRGGKVTQSDLILAQSDVLLLEDQLEVLSREINQANAALIRWVGEENSGRMLSGQPDFHKTQLVFEDLNSELAKLPELIVQERLIALADSDVRLARSNKHADWTVELSYAQRGSEFSDMASIGVSVPIQWDQARRQNRELAARQAKLEQARAERDEQVFIETEELRALAEDWRSGLSRLRRYNEKLLPLSKARQQSALASWRGGRGSLSDVLSARRALLDTHLNILQLEVKTALAWADLEFRLPKESGSKS